ncbi:hypothetical protein [Frigoribacterium sp. CFBP 13707]|uniref:hypothetical protein n=1 Tax=Frigoribacterium sp. CFBP 13707 TaxID=2775313 RepID=UPI00177E3058|nr:hypothetical protein [Frigoribacterium sp. CFBP 13707]MBD8726324.1 hypothetical protein [Frigoribacterium sp. CFBP 13707]
MARAPRAPRDRDPHAHGSRFGDLVESMNARLRPYIGGAQLGLKNEAPPVAPAHGGACPLCGAPMDEHVVDRTGPRTMVHCPGTPRAARADAGS